MKPEIDYQMTFCQLNEDCQRLIFEKLNVLDQFNIMKTHPNFEHIILRIWKVKFRKEIDFHKFKNMEQLCIYNLLGELLPILFSFTKALLNFDLILSNYYLVNEVFPNILKITARTRSHIYAHTKILPDIPKTFPNLEILYLQEAQVDLLSLCKLSSLRELQLVHCFHNTEREDCAEIFRNFRLKSFTLLSSIRTPQPSLDILRAAKYCSTLQKLGLNVADLKTAFKQLEQLPPQVKHLRVFTTISFEVGDVVPHEMHRVIRELSESAIMAPRIVAVRMRCNFPKRVCDYMKCMPNLREFGWQSHIACGAESADWVMAYWYCWPLYHPQTICNTLLQFIHECRTLQKLDFRWNFIVTPSFLTGVKRLMRRSALNDAPTIMRSDIPLYDDAAVDDYKPVNIEWSNLLHFGCFEIDFENVDYEQ